MFHPLSSPPATLPPRCDLPCGLPDRVHSRRKVVYDFKHMLGDTTCVFDREYSTQGFLETMQEMQLSFVE